MNTFGHLFRITTFGESHGKALGVIIDGCPAGLEIDEDFIQAELAKLRTGFTPANQNATHTVATPSRKTLGGPTASKVCFHVDRSDNNDQYCC